MKKGEVYLWLRQERRKQPVRLHFSKSIKTFTSSTLKQLTKLDLSHILLFSSNDLVVTVHECKDLPVKYTGGTMYKYVEIEMFPFHRMTSNKPKTRYIRNDFSPVFEEEVNRTIPSHPSHYSISNVSVVFPLFFFPSILLFINSTSNSLK
jgi:hypothetical protein